MRKSEKELMTVNLTKLFKNKILNQDSGVTLVELLASIFLLSIIITGFLSFFIQAARTNNRIDEVNEATFIAQEQLEIITALSENKNLADTKKEIFSETIDSKTVIVSDYNVFITFLDSENPHPVIVKVSKGGKDLAQMETRLSFSKAGETK